MYSSVTTNTQVNHGSNSLHVNTRAPRPTTESRDFVAAHLSGPHTSTYYIGNVSPNVGVEVISNYLYEQYVNVINIRVFRSKRPGVNAAKIDVRSDDAHIIESPDFWPRGVYARLWHE